MEDLLAYGWPTDPDWVAFAKQAGVTYDLAALKQHLAANPVWAAVGDDDPRRFQRDLTLSDETGA